MKRRMTLVPKFITNNKSDRYVAISADDNEILTKTSLKIDDLNPIWNETFDAPVAHYIKGITLSVEDKNIMGTSELIRKIFVPVADLVKFDETTQCKCQLLCIKLLLCSLEKREASRVESWNSF